LTTGAVGSVVIAEVPAVVYRRRGCLRAGFGAGPWPGIRWPVSCGHPRCRKNTTYVPGPGRCERPDDRRRSNSEPGCEARSQGARGSLADHRRGEEKIFCCVTTRGCNIRVLEGLGRDFGSLPALLLGLGMLESDHDVLAMFGLPPGRLPAMNLLPAFRVLAVALVPASGLVYASAFVAHAEPRARSPRSGQTAVSVSNVDRAHGSGNSQGKARGEC
jgi:hypothetical protein